MKLFRLFFTLLWQGLKIDRAMQLLIIMFAAVFVLFAGVAGVFIGWQTALFVLGILFLSIAGSIVVVAFVSAVSWAIENIRSHVLLALVLFFAAAVILFSVTGLPILTGLYALSICCTH